MTETSDILLSRTTGGIRVLTLNRPHVANAIDPALSAALVRALRQADKDPVVGAIVIAAAGDRHFCAGVDMKAITRADTACEEPPLLDRSAPNLCEVVLRLRKPVLCAIEGAAVGGGMELALACDLRIAGANARFGLPEARRGMTSHFGSVMLPRVASRGAAFYMLYTGDIVDAAEAHRLGIVTRLTGPGEALDAALAMAGRIAANAPLSLRRMKATIQRSDGMPIAAALQLDEGPDPLTSEDRKEGMRAFVEGREPRWTGA